MTSKSKDKSNSMEPHNFAKLYYKEFGKDIVEMLGTLVVYHNGDYNFVDLKDIIFPHKVKEIYMNDTIIDSNKVFKPFTTLEWLCGSPIITCTDMNQMFSKTKFQGDISQWNTRNVTDMSYMFSNSKFQGDISQWDTSNVTNMRCMF